jgi:hypothetical protein
MFKLFSPFKSRVAQAPRHRPSLALREGSSAPRTEADWARARSPLRERDLTLAGNTHAWLARLPPGVQPQRLGAKFPGVANRLALCWDDHALIERVFDSLLLDRRGGRAGFPPGVANELMRLRAYRARFTQADDTAPGLWDNRNLAVSDR